MIDSHCHPDDAAFAADSAEVLARAGEQLAGLVAIDGLDWLRKASLPQGLLCWATVGVHPHQAADWNKEREAALREALSDARVIGIGEIGLDYHYDNSPRARQIEVFTRQVALAAEHRLPVSVHCREAWEDGFAVMENERGTIGVLHCFSGGQKEAERALGLGWYLSFSGMLTFPKLETLRAVAGWAPAERILVETDAPYLAPVPRRGRRNEPAWVWETARALAACRKQSVEEIEQLTTGNFTRLFALAGAGCRAA
ncbi:MAG: TatD family hydrolase [Terriglobales bacterium]